ncbi:MAG: hypothetical protein LWX55_10205 [Deltaproteobacteria bacterium]|jgi:hypothetical protein|nr:hypothetical protein [Deltaproteobacteria bacterium]
MTKDADRKFLNRYFRSVYNKLEADVLLFNRRLPHQGLKGSENEQTLADILIGFLPTRYGVEVNALIIDRNGAVSRQCDIVIYDNVQFPKYFRKVYPIETVHAVIEVKTELTKQQVDSALQNEAALRKLKFQSLLTPYWQTKTKKNKIPHASPVHCIFGYRSSTEDFGTFIGWFSNLPSQTRGDENFPYCSPFNHFIVCALDKGLIFCRGDGHIPRWLAVAEEIDNERNFPIVGDGHRLEVGPAKALFLFLETLWTMIEQSPRHPGFDIRSYMDDDLGTFIPFTDDGKVENR